MAEGGAFGTLSLRLLDYQPYLCEELFTSHIRPAASIGRVLSRVPHIALKWFIAFVVNIEARREGEWQKHDQIEIDAEVERGVSELASILIEAVKGCQKERQAIRCVYFSLKELLEWEWVYVNLTLDAAELASHKVEGQRWVWEGFYDEAVEGQREISAHVPELGVELLGVELLLHGLTGEQRHKLIAYVNECRSSGYTPDELLERVVYYGTYDSIDRHRLYWEALGVNGIKDLDPHVIQSLARWILSLSFGTLAVPRLQRGLAKPSAVNVLRDIVGMSRFVTADTREVVDGILLNYLHFHQYGETGWREWSGKGPHDSLHGYYGKALEHEYIDALKQKEYPLKETTMEWLSLGDERPVKRAKKRSLAEIEGDSAQGVGSLRSSLNAYSPNVSRRFEQINKSSRFTGETEIETGLLPRTPEQKGARTIVGWIEDTQTRYNFRQRIQVGLDIQAAFRAVYGAGLRSDSIYKRPLARPGQLCAICVAWRRPCPNHDHPHAITLPWWWEDAAGRRARLMKGRKANIVTIPSSGAKYSQEPIGPELLPVLRDSPAFPRKVIRFSEAFWNNNCKFDNTGLPGSRDDWREGSRDVSGGGGDDE
jgi:hypothetical protein